MAQIASVSLLAQWYEYDTEFFGSLVIGRGDVLSDHCGVYRCTGQPADDQRPFVGPVNIGVVHRDGDFDDHVDSLVLVVLGRDDDVGLVQLL